MRTVKYYSQSMDFWISSIVQNFKQVENTMFFSSLEGREVTSINV
jgi:hypothetical protein